MLTIELLRDPFNPLQTLGRINDKQLPFFCHTLELPWKDNKNQVSCIPADKYLCKWTRSNRISGLHLQRWLKKNPGKTVEDCPDSEKNVYTYELFNVKGRTGIRIHSANYFFDLKGCIAFGDALKDINIDSHLDVIHSGKTIELFAAMMNYQDFYLDIRNAA